MRPAWGAPDAFASLQHQKAHLQGSKRVQNKMRINEYKNDGQWHSCTCAQLHVRTFGVSNTCAPYDICIYMLHGQDTVWHRPLGHLLWAWCRCRWRGWHSFFTWHTLRNNWIWIQCVSHATDSSELLAGWSIGLNAPSDFVQHILKYKQDFLKYNNNENN